MSVPSSERALAASIAVHQSWANTIDRAARTAPARAAHEKKFLDAADGDPVRAEHLKKAHFARLALKSAQSRRKAKELAAAAAAAETELAEAGDPVRSARAQGRASAGRASTARNVDRERGGRRG